MTVLEALRGVRDLLGDSTRWAQGSYVVFDEKAHTYAYCLAGALNKVCRYEIDTIIEVQDVVQKQLSISFIRWNDAPERTHAEVLALLDTVIGALA